MFSHGHKGETTILSCWVENILIRGRFPTERDAEGKETRDFCCFSLFVFFAENGAFFWHFFRVFPAVGAPACLWTHPLCPRDCTVSLAKVRHAVTAFIPLGRPFFLFLLFHFSPHSDRKRLFFRRFSATNPGRNGGVATLPKKRLDDAYHVHVWDRFFVFFVGQEIRRSHRRSWSTEMAPLPSGGLEWPTNATPARRFFSVFCRFLFCFSKWRRPLAEPSTPGSRFVFVLSSRFYRRQNENDHTEPPTSSSNRQKTFIFSSRDFLLHSLNYNYCPDS